MTKMCIGPHQAADVQVNGQCNPETMTTDPLGAATSKGVMHRTIDAALMTNDSVLMGPLLPNNIVLKRSAPQVGSAPTQPERAAEEPRLEPNVEEMIRCLRWLRPDEPRWLITALNPVAKKGSRNATTYYLKDDAAAPAKLRDANSAGLNVYFPTGTPRPTWDAATKNQPRKERDEIESCSILYFDGDFLDQEGNIIATEESRLYDIGAAVAAGAIPAPGLTICSGNGVQCFWRTRRPLDPGQAEGRNRWLIELLHGDSGVWDRGRLMRVGGGINWPSKRKTGKGCVPVLGRIVSIDDNAWALADHFQWVPEKKEDKAKTKPAGAAAEVDTAETEERPEPVTSIDDTRLAAVRSDVKQIILEGNSKKYPSRSEAAFRVACDLARCGLSDALIRSVFENFKIGDTLRDASRKFDDGIKRLIERAQEAAVDEELAEMNGQHCVIEDIGGKCMIANETLDLKRKEAAVTFSTAGALNTRYANRQKVVGKDDKGRDITKPLAEWWIHHPRRRQCKQITFAPNQDIPGAFNMWRGFAVEPAQGDCKLYLDHLHDNICSGDNRLNEYILNWMASGVQHPDEPGRTAISLRGAPGDGKGVFVLGYGRIFGRHFLQITQPDHLTGKFNAHEAEAVLIYADEVAFAGDHKAARIFKTKISEETKLLERKGIDTVEVDNYARYIFSTNEDHPLQIEHNDRRYLAIKVRTNPLWAAETDQRDAAHKRRAYFVPILDQMRMGGRAALLDLLLNRDISKFNPEAFPRTDESRIQKHLSAPAGDRLVIEFALDGQLPGAVNGRPWIAQARGDGCLYDAMRERGGYRERMSDETYLAGIIKGWGFVRHPLGYGAGWRAPSLADLRQAIDKKYPGFTWDPEIGEWGQRIKTEAEQPAAKDHRGKPDEPTIPF